LVIPVTYYIIYFTCYSV